MFENLLAAAAIFWALWIVCNFCLLALSAWLATPDHPCFNGFAVKIPVWLPQVLTEEEVAAIVAHEDGHRELWHVWENFGQKCYFSKVTPQRLLEQELEADDFACDTGHGRALASALGKLSTHPSTLMRVERILLKYC